MKTENEIKDYRNKIIKERLGIIHRDDSYLVPFINFDKLNQRLIDIDNQMEVLNFVLEKLSDDYDEDW